MFQRWNGSITIIGSMLKDKLGAAAWIVTMSGEAPLHT